LEHERSLRELDQRRAAQTKARLERHVQFASEEADEAKVLLEEVRRASEEHARTLREGRQEALSELRDCQERLNEFAVEQQGRRGFEDKAAKEKVAHLENRLEAYKEEVESLTIRLREVIAEAEDLRRTVPDEAKKDDDKTEPLTGQASAAPKAVLQELNKVRIAFAESERKYRQLHRKSEDWHKKAQQFVQLKEISEEAKLRILKLELDSKEMHREMESRRATNERWEEFAKDVGQVLQVTTTGPPELATVLRHLQKQQQRVKTLEAEAKDLKRDLANSVDKVASLEVAIRDATMATARSQRDVKNTQRELDQAKLQIQILHAQEKIWQREADSLRALVQTFDDIVPGPPDCGKSAATMSVDLALATARDETAVIKQEQDQLIKALESAENEKQRLEKDHERVLDKYTKLRDALLAERAKAENAEDRAMKAETLAGKGMINPHLTRALHLEENPLSDAIRERYQSEINSLKLRLDAISGESIASTGIPAKPDVDPEKLHQRLKDTFKEQIGIFREGVYLITGYKIDMLLEKSTPYFKVRSVYAEREEDVLVFNWPKGVKQPKSLDLRANDFARVLSTTDSYQYLTKYDSMPGFMASTQLSLLEKCTFVSSSVDK
jgi:Mitotic checkpoint protein